jgi:hypothetical protein
MRQEQDIARLARSVGEDTAREAVASLAGLMLRRMQDMGGTVTFEDLSSMWGEALNDFSEAKEHDVPERAELEGQAVRIPQNG